MRREPSSVYVQLNLICAVFACLGLMAGCTATSPTVAAPATTTSQESMPSDRALVVRQGRYTLVELTPESAQDDLMQQVVDITFPAAAIHSVADALRYLLLHSGYRMSEDCEAAHAFDDLPLPAAHAHLGPLTLRNGLQVLVGPGWQLQGDDASRTVCFARGDLMQPTNENIQSRTPEHSHD